MKKKVVIINTGSHLPKASATDWLELQSNRKKLVTKPILNQSRRDGTVIYGAHAVNKLVGPKFSRTTYDYDVYSRMPLKHARQLERSIDRGTNSDLAYIEQTNYPVGGKQKKLWRVKTRINESTEADYNTMPADVSYVKRNGVRYETLKRAEGKYRFMNKNPEATRTGFGELERIKQYKMWGKKK